MKIIKLTAANIKKLVAVEIAPSTNVVKITGRNEQGKTSVLDSIYWALAGAANIQEVPLRSGEQKGFVELDLGDIIVRRTFTEKHTALTVSSKDGMTYKTPQAVLDGIIGRLSFDPLGFARQDPAAQLKVLKQLTGVDTDSLDAQRSAHYQKRTAINAEVARLRAQLSSLPVRPAPPAPPTEVEVSLTALSVELTEAMKLQSHKESVTAAAAELVRQVASKEVNIKDWLAEIEQLQLKVANAKSEIDRLTVESQQKISDIALMTVPDVEALKARFKQTEQANAAIREQQKAHDVAATKAASFDAEKARLEAELKSKFREAAALTDAIEKIDATKLQMVRDAKFPLPDLGFGDGAVTYKSRPFAQASSAERLRVSTAIAMALNPKLRVIRITDGSLLDSASMSVIEEMARDKDFQVWCEVVDESGKVGVVIEDGQVAAVN